MIEKRFVFDPSINHFTDTYTDNEYSEYNLDDVVDLLNDFHNENIVLKKTNQKVNISSIGELGKKRFELHMNSNGGMDIIDWLESKQKCAICIYNDLGIYPFSSAEALCDLLNKLYEEKKESSIKLFECECEKSRLK